MAKQICRMQDIGIGKCSAHRSIQSVVGIIITGSTNKTSDNLGVARSGDILICTCGHVATIQTGSATVQIGGKQQAGVGDFFTGPPTGTLVTGSTKTMA